jgi:hypothetical protein
MAKKARKKSAAKLKKKSTTRKQAKAVSRKRKARKAKPRSFGARVSGAYRTVVDTVKDTGRMRRKMERPGTDETE